MEKLTVKEDVKVFGFQVKDFRTGIGPAFDTLVKMVPGGFTRSFYGISEMSKDGMNYRVAAVEKKEGEAELYHCQRYTIEQGEYFIVELRDWRKKTDSIKDIFGEMFSDTKADKTKPWVEWYQNEDKMLCMVKVLR